MDPDKFLQIKEKATKSYLQKNYIDAINQYTECLQLDNKNDIILSNRSQCYLNLKNYYNALIDAQLAYNINNQNVKAFFRILNAYKGLEQFKQGIQFINNNLKEQHTKIFNENFITYQHISKQSFEKYLRQQQGYYDTEQLHKQIFNSKNKEMEIANYTGPLSIQFKNKKYGRGLFATQNIKKNDIILVQKPILIGNPQDQDDIQRSKKYINKEIQIQYKDQQSQQQKDLDPFSCVQVEKMKELLYNNKLDFLRISYLFDGDNKDNLIPNISLFTNEFENQFKEFENSEDENLKNIKEQMNNQYKNMQIDDQRIIQIIQKNNFSFTNSKNQDCTGLFILANFFNHSCINNVQQFYIGNSMFVRAVKNINKGEELLLDYVQYDQKFCLASMRDSFLQKTKQFTCLCELCNYQLNNSSLLDWSENFYMSYADNKMKDEALEKLFDQKQILNNLQYYPAVQAIIAQFYNVFQNKSIEEIENQELKIPGFDLNKMNIYFQGEYFKAKLYRVMVQLGQYWKNNNNSQIVSNLLHKLCVLAKKVEEILQIYNGYSEEILIDFMGNDMYKLYKTQSPKIQQM